MQQPNVPNLHTVAWNRMYAIPRQAAIQDRNALLLHKHFFTTGMIKTVILLSYLYHFIQFTISFPAGTICLCKYSMSTIKYLPINNGFNFI